MNGKLVHSKLACVARSFTGVCARPISLNDIRVVTKHTHTTQRRVAPLTTATHFRRRHLHPHAQLGRLPRLQRARGLRRRVVVSRAGSRAKREPRTRAPARPLRFTNDGSGAKAARLAARAVPDPEDRPPTFSAARGTVGIRSRAPRARPSEVTRGVGVCSGGASSLGSWRAAACGADPCRVRPRPLTDTAPRLPRAKSWRGGTLPAAHRDIVGPASPPALCSVSGLERYGGVYCCGS